MFEVAMFVLFNHSKKNRALTSSVVRRIQTVNMSKAGMKQKSAEVSFKREENTLGFDGDVVSVMSIPFSYLGRRTLKAAYR